MTTDAASRWLARLRWLVPAVLVLLTLLQYWQAKPAAERADQDSALAVELWARQPNRFPLESLHQAWLAPVRPSPIAIFDAGDGPWLGSSLYLQLGKLARAQDQAGYDYFAAGRQIELSPALFLQIAIPAVAILIAWKRPGHPVRQIIELLETVAPAAAAALGLTAALESTRLGGDSATRLLLLLASYLLYAVAVFGVCRIALRWIRMDLALSCLIIFWLGNAALARPLSVNLAAAFYPLPTLESLIRQLDYEVAMGYQGADPRADRDRRHVAEALRDYKVATVEQLPVNLSAILLQKEELHRREVFDRRLGELRGQFEKQERFERFLGFLFPQVAIQLLSHSLAATDFASERWMLASVDAQWDGIVQRVYEHVTVTSGPEGRMPPVGPEFWRQFAPPVPQLPPAAYGMQEGLLPVLALGVWIGAGFGLTRRKNAA